MRTSFIAWYRGETIEEAELIAITGNQKVVRDPARHLVDADEVDPAGRPEPQEGNR